MSNIPGWTVCENCGEDYLSVFSSEYFCDDECILEPCACKRGCDSEEHY